MPTTGKLSLNVDFYRRGFFPPGAFHSEGHQDGMGLCLYLALMRHLMGTGFTLAVLDDVLMSVDAGHRREISRLLKAEFPDVQFVLTTHDRAWLKQMTNNRLVGSKDVIQFRRWSVEDGPSAWGGDDTWGEIAAYLDVDDVRGAAALLRHTLEHLAAEHCHDLRTPVVFDLDGRPDLTDLLEPAVKRLKDLLREAEAAARSWDDDARASRVADRSADLDLASASALAELWPVNAAVHNNPWAALNVNELRPVAQAFRSLVACFSCEKCGDAIAVSPRKGTRERLECHCGRWTHGFAKRQAERRRC